MFSQCYAFFSAVRVLCNTRRPPAVAALIQPPVSPITSLLSAAGAPGLDLGVTSRRCCDP